MNESVFVLINKTKKSCFVATKRPARMTFRTKCAIFLNKKGSSVPSLVKGLIATFNFYTAGSGKF